MKQTEQGMGKYGLIPKPPGFTCKAHIDTKTPTVRVGTDGCSDISPCSTSPSSALGCGMGGFLCLSVRPGPPVPGGDSTNSNHRSHMLSGLRPNFCWKHLLVSHNLNRTGSHMGVTLNSAFRRARTHLQTNTQLMLLE